MAYKFNPFTKKPDYYESGSGSTTDDVARDNIMILAWKIAIAEGLTKFNLEDGAVDEFEDETGVDTTNSINESYNSTDDYYSPVAGSVVDNMEYSTDALAQAAYVTNAVATSIPPSEQSDTYVKATTKFSTNYWPYFATDPTKSVTGATSGNAWVSANGTVTNQRFHIDLGAATVITRIYYENFHESGNSEQAGVRNFTFWGSNTAEAFSELTYATDTGWTQLTTSQSSFDQHSDPDAADPKYISVTNTTAYRYYAFKFADNWGDAAIMGVRRIHLQLYPLQSYSESTIKTKGSYSLKGVAASSASLCTLTRTLASAIDLSGISFIKLDLRSDRLSNNLAFGFRNSGSVVSSFTPSLASTATWTSFVWSLDVVSNGAKDAISMLYISLINTSASNTFYVDNWIGPLTNMTLISSYSEAETEPSTARYLALVEPVDAITVNTDVKGYVSEDNGSNYDQVTLTDEGYFDSSKKILAGNVSITDRSDKTMRQKLTTHNNKDLKVHAWGMLWK
jgi:hypothetical protein